MTPYWTDADDAGGFRDLLWVRDIKEEDACAVREKNILL
jgi:hypothetical protein